MPTGGGVPWGWFVLIAGVPFARHRWSNAARRAGGRRERSRTPSPTGRDHGCGRGRAGRRRGDRRRERRRLGVIGILARRARPRPGDRDHHHRPQPLRRDRPPGPASHRGPLRAREPGPDRRTSSSSAVPTCMPATPTGTKPPTHPSTARCPSRPRRARRRPTCSTCPGAVEFACHLPGHYQYGMRGVVDVVAPVN